MTSNAAKGTALPKSIVLGSIDRKDRLVECQAKCDFSAF